MDLEERLEVVPPVSSTPTGGCPTLSPSRSVALTSGCTSCSESKKGTNGGRPKWVMERSPVNRLLFNTFWKCRSQMYWKRDQHTSDGPAGPGGLPTGGPGMGLTSMVVRRSNFSASCVM